MAAFVSTLVASVFGRGPDTRNRALIAGSDYFDADWYLSVNPDVATSGMDPALHYLRFGASEGRNPSPAFNSVRYLAENGDVRSAGANPLVHFLRHGQAEGRRIFKVSDSWKRSATSPRARQETGERPVISVVIPIYDRVRELEEAIQSILTQTFTRFELLLVTDGSPDETMAVIEKYRRHPKVRVFEFPTSSGNAVRGRNKGILEARGDYVAFLDSDDIAFPDRLETSLRFIEETGADVVYGAWQALLDGSRDVPGITDGQLVQSPDATLDMLEKHCVPCQSTVMVRKSVFDRAGPLKRAMEYREDHELWARLAYHGASFRSIETPLVKLRLHAGNNELNFLDADGSWFEKFSAEYKTPAMQPQKIVFVLPGVGINGGIAVVLRHAHMLIAQGHDVTLVNTGTDGDLTSWYPVVKVPVLHYETCDDYYFDNIDMLFATGWQTAEYLDVFEARRKLYFVQSDERRFSDVPEEKQRIADTYRIDCEYLTEARWIQRFLKDEFGHASYYVPNGLDLTAFHPNAPLLAKGNRPRILIEGPVVIPFKGVKDAYNAVKDLDADIWLVSSAGGPEQGWKIDRFFEAVPFGQMNEIYASCDIFIKMSRIEGFFGPPLEAMACGCAVVVSKVTGYDEYIVDGENALVVEMGDVAAAGKAVERLLNDADLRNTLIENGFRTAAQWGWDVSRDAMKAVVKKATPSG